MLLEVLAVAVAALVIGATLALIWTERDRAGHRADHRHGHRRDPPWTTPADQPTAQPQPAGFDLDHEPGRGLLLRPPRPHKTRHPLKPDHELGMACTKDAKPYCVEGVEYVGSCDLRKHVFPPGAKIQSGFCEH